MTAETNITALHSFNTVIIGSGAAGLNAALCLHERGVENIAIVTERIGAGTSNNAGSDKQTYYKLALDGEKPDSTRLMAADLFSGGLMHGDIALCEAAHSAQCFFRLAQLGVRFPHDRYGSFPGYQTDHDKFSRATSAGPLTSRDMAQCLLSEIKRRDIPVFDGFQVIELLTREQNNSREVFGALAFDLNKLDDSHHGLTAFSARNVILATGGPAGMYAESVYPPSQFGAHGLAFAAGAVAHNLTESQFGLAAVKFRWNVSGSYQQVIPRYFSTDANGGDEREFLVDSFPDLKTMARAIFLKGYQWPFDVRKTANYGSSAIDLAVYNETVVKKRKVFLDYCQNPSHDRGAFRLEDLDEEVYRYLNKSDAIAATPIERLRKLNLPAIELFKSNGIDITTEPLEIAVCAQHNNGGFAGNIWWESNVRHLFSIGEANGTHGVYRPGGAALNAGQVGGLRAAMWISARYKAEPPDNSDFIHDASQQIEAVKQKIRSFLSDETDRHQSHWNALKDIQRRMSDHAGIYRRLDDVQQAVATARKQFEQFEITHKAESIADIPAMFRVRDVCLTHWIYLEAIAEYLRLGGASRGAFIVLNEKPDNHTKTQVNAHSEASDKIIEVVLTPENDVKKTLTEVRDIPVENNWFEKTWEEFRSNSIYK